MRLVLAVALVLASSCLASRAVTLTGTAGTSDLPTARQAAIAAEHCKVGDKALHAKDADAAAAAYGAALAAFPYHPGARIGLGHVAMLRGDFGAALDEYNRAQSAWESLRATVDRARADKARKAAESAAAVMEYVTMTSHDTDEQVAIPGMPHTSDMLKNAMLESQVKDLRHAEEETQPSRGAEGDAADAPAGLAADRPPAQIGFFRGTALYRLGRVDEAVAAWRDVQLREPGFAPVYNNLVEGLLRLDRKDEARTMVKAAAERGFKVHPALVAAAGP